MTKEAIKVYKKEFLKDNQTVLAYASTPKHKHEFWEFVYWIKGKSKNVFEEITFNTAPGLVLFIRPNDVHENSTISVSYTHRDIYILEEELRGICDIIQEGLFEELINSNTPPTFNIGIKDIEFLESLMSKANIVGCRMDSGIRKAVITGLLGLYLTSRQSTQRQPLVVTELVDLIEESLRKMRSGEIQERIELQDLVSQLKYDYSHVSRVFKKYMVVSPKEFYIQKKMSMAAVLLLDGLSISQVTSVLQYTANSHFVKAFKNYYGVTPSMWRNSYEMK